jgi:hypothetical protein
MISENSATCSPSKPKRAWATLKNVLTAKNGLFWGILAEKRGVCALQKPFYFVFFWFFGNSCLASH